MGKLIRDIIFRTTPSLVNPKLYVAKSRKCLMCGEMFHSEWAGNRRCISCNRRAILTDSLINQYAECSLSGLGQYSATCNNAIEELEEDL